MRFLFSILLVGALGLTACENETAYEVPTIEDEFISFSINDQNIVLNAIGESGSYANSLAFYGERSNQLTLSRTSRDLSTTLTISGNDLPLTKVGDDVTFNAPGYVPVNIHVRTNEMSGSIYCPHQENVESMVYEGLIRIENITKEGAVSGKFMTDPAGDNPVVIQDGEFELGISVR